MPDLTPRQSRAVGALLGQLAGDSLGSLVEFKRPDEIRALYPDGVRDLADGGTWNTIAGQPTDDSEMALALARTLVADGVFDPQRVRAAYRAWLDSRPFDKGGTVTRGLIGNTDPNSQANGAMMRACPLGIFAATVPLEEAAAWARADAALTHPNRVTLQANALYVMAIAEAVHTGCDGATLYGNICAWLDGMAAPEELHDATLAAADGPPPRFAPQAGWVLIAWRNALHRLLRSPSLEEGIVDTVMQGGDTDTNAAICGALLGAVHGAGAVPERWVRVLRGCRADRRPHVTHPRPEMYWPVDAEELAIQLVEGPRM